MFSPQYAVVKRTAVEELTRHALLALANCLTATSVVLSCVLGWPDAALLSLHFLLAVTSAAQIAVCFVGAGACAAQRQAPQAVHERTGTIMQGLVLLGVLLGLAVSTIIANVRESVAAAGAANATTNI